MKTAYSLENLGGRWRYRDEIEKVEAAIPPGLEPLGLFQAEEPEGGDAPALLASALAAPLGAPPLRELARGRRRAAIIVSDATRAVATAQALPPLTDELIRAGLAWEDIFLVVAVGVHREATGAELGEIAGGLRDRLGIFNHDPRDPEKLRPVGVTRRGTRVEVNRLAAEADLRLAVGKVEPHEFAGYSGGRKSVLPGIAGEKTILFNHRPEMIADPLAVPGRLEGNPIHEDMLEAARLLGLDFCLNLVQNAAGRPLAAFAGGLEESHAAAVAYYERRYGLEVDSTANILLTTPGHPLNIDLYQSMKPFFGLAPILKPGDVVILYSGCREGVNSDDMLKPFEYGPNLDRIMNFLLENYRIQMDHSLLFCKLLRKGVRAIAVSPAIPGEIFSRLLMRPAASLEQALEVARDWQLAAGAIPRLGIVPAPPRLILKSHPA
ncbi:MAG: nickel-dependent lactate racemase [Planctomycetota bacterium]|jgi:nickel-dependent lactate racemase|nr:nickel-dependent lactate racemase [Planctomycetota bacterium]